MELFSIRIQRTFQLVSTVLSIAAHQNYIAIRLPERPVYREEEVSRRYRPARTGRAGIGHDGGGGHQSGTGQDIRQVCDPAARKLYSKLLPPFTGAGRQGDGSPSPRCRRYYRLDRTKYRRTPAHNLQAKRQECRSVGRFRLHPDYTAGVHFSFEQTVVRVFMSPNANRKECHWVMWFSIKTGDFSFWNLS